MPRRISYGFSADGTGRGDGLIFSDMCDLKFRNYNNYADVAWGVDRNGSGALTLGQRLTGVAAPYDQSMPVIVNGGFGLGSMKQVSGTYQVTKDDTILMCDSSGGSVTATLPPLGSTIKGTLFYFYRNSRSNSVTISPYSGDNIEDWTGTQFQMPPSPNNVVVLMADTGVRWRRVQQNAYGIWLQHEFGMNPYVTINSSSFQLVRGWSNVLLSNRDIMVIVQGSGWYDNGEGGIVEFAVFVDGVQGPIIGWYHSQGLQINLNFTGECLLYNTAGLHTVEIKARVRTGSHTFTMDNNDFFTCDLIQF